MKKDLDIASLYDTAFYEVVDERTHKYSSTDVHESTDFAGNSRVSSNVSYHSDQNVWVKDVETGKERKFSFNSYNISVRPGHKILCAWNKKSSKLERIVNLSTDDTSAGNGVYNYWAYGSRGNYVSKLLKKPFKVDSETIFISLFAALPFLGTLALALFSLAVLFKMKGAFLAATPDKDDRYLRWNFLYLGLTVFSIHNCLYIISNFKDVGAMGFILYLALAFGLIKFLQGSYIVEYQIIKKHSDALDAYLQSLISLNRTKWKSQEEKREPEAALI